MLRIARFLGGSSLNHGGVSVKWCRLTSIPIIKIGWSHGSFILNKDHHTWKYRLYIETGPRRWSRRFAAQRPINRNRDFFFSAPRWIASWMKLAGEIKEIPPVVWLLYASSEIIKVINFTTLFSLMAPWVILMTTYCVTCDVKLTIFCFQCQSRGTHRRDSSAEPYITIDSAISWHHSTPISRAEKKTGRFHLSQDTSCIILVSSQHYISIIFWLYALYFISNLQPVSNWMNVFAVTLSKRCRIDWCRRLFYRHARTNRSGDLLPGY